MTGVVRRSAFVLPGLLLVVFGLNQIRLSFYHDLNPWKGGGFGMFASTDRVSTRMIRCKIVSPTGREGAVRLGKNVKGAVARARAYPSDANLEAVALVMAQHAKDEGKPASRIAIEFWRHHFDTRTAEQIPRLGRTFTYQVPGDD